MRKFIKFRYFILAGLMVVSMTAFSVIAYKKAHAMCTAASGTCKSTSEDNGSGELLWETLSHQLVPTVSIH